MILRFADDAPPQPRPQPRSVSFTTVEFANPKSLIPPPLSSRTHNPNPNPRSFSNHNSWICKPQVSHTATFELANSKSLISPQLNSRTHNLSPVSLFIFFFLSTLDKICHLMNIEWSSLVSYFCFFFFFFILFELETEPLNVSISISLIVKKLIIFSWKAHITPPLTLTRTLKFVTLPLLILRTSSFKYCKQWVHKRLSF